MDRVGLNMSYGFPDDYLIIFCFVLSGWFGMRKDFCEFLLDAIPLLREYGNISYKFSDTVVSSNRNVNESGSDSSIEVAAPDSIKMRDTSKPIASVMFIDIPD